MWFREAEESDAHQTKPGLTVNLILIYGLGLCFPIIPDNRPEFRSCFEQVLGSDTYTRLGRPNDDSSVKV